jgi:hypothetical protein
MLVAHTGGSATREAEIGWIQAQGQPWQKKFLRLPFQGGKKLGMMACACHPSDSGKHKIGRW